MKNALGFIEAGDTRSTCEFAGMTGRKPARRRRGVRFGGKRKRHGIAAELAQRDFDNVGKRVAVQIDGGRVRVRTTVKSSRVGGRRKRRKVRIE